MLKKIAPLGKKIGGGNFAIVAARYNRRYTDALVRFASAELQGAGAYRVQVVRVPGSFEVPVVAAKLARAIPCFDAVICFGAILRGQTTHAQSIADAVSLSLAQIQISSLVPMIHGVLLFENEKQAAVRCLQREHNRGTEAARVAIEMMKVMRSLKSTAPGRGAKLV